ncbi:hypothetical protein [Garciella nitratireducens]|uniref:hypothetical protein n=1 Tax=Garciella nitratireducens TaxID=218205 RepID=UPI000DE900CF|nr:hypothetical protein [Garciella nitratireducens]
MNFLTISENIQLLFSLHSIELTQKTKQMINQLYEKNQLLTFPEHASLGMNIKIGCSLLFEENHWDLVILDETFSSVDEFSRKILLKQCEKLTYHGCCVIIISHNHLENECDFLFQKLYLSKGSGLINV